MDKQLLVGSQIYVGPEERREFSIERIKAKIKSAKDLLNLQKLMVWTQFDREDPEFYPSILKICHALDIEVYLWFPVLSDIHHFTVKPEYIVENYTGRRGNGTIGVWNNRDAMESAFQFVCPNHPEVQRKIHTALTHYLTSNKDDFDGIFLDKVRYPSVANGFESLFTCFCPHCQGEFHERYNLSLADYKTRAGDLVAHIRQMDDRLLREDPHILPNLFNLREDPIWHKFFSFREAIITTVVETCNHVAADNGKKVALDLYSPSLSAMVSQKYDALLPHADWIKPMVYCHAQGPAGIPFEIGRMVAALQDINPRLTDRGILTWCEKCLDLTLPATAHDLQVHGISEDNAGREIDRLGMLSPSSVPSGGTIYPGIETIMNAGYGTNITESILHSYFDEIRPRSGGFIASWNLLRMPEENLRFLADRL